VKILGIKPGERVAVHKLNTQGTDAISYEAELESVLPNGVRLAARWTRPPLALGYTTFETGDHFTEWFFTDLWYNIFDIASSRGRHKGWYCNIAEPALIALPILSSRDLLLDLWVNNDYTMQVLDEEEFAADRFLTPEMRALALQGLDELRTRVEQRQPPFDR